MRQAVGQFWRVTKAVLWSFVGVRSRSEFDKDVQQIHPFHMIAAGLVFAVLFVLGLLALVRWVVAQPIAL